MGFRRGDEKQYGTGKPGAGTQPCTGVTGSRVNRKWGRCVFVWGTGGHGGGITALPGSFTARGRGGERGGGWEFPRLLGDRSVNGRGIRVHAWRRGRAFARRWAPARHPSGIHDSDTHAAVGQDHSQSNEARACELVRGRSFSFPHHERIPGYWGGLLTL